jgi:predicted dehydrogenase
MNIAIIGAGLIGRKRAAALAAFPDDAVRVVCDIQSESARSLAAEHACDAVSDWREALREDVDAVVVATMNAVLAPIACAAFAAGKHVLCEKPLGRNVAEAEEMVEAARRADRILKTGFNHRFHPTLMTAKRIADDGGIGRIFSVRARYGHGARPGMEQEWRSSKELCGGGELLDQGVHVIDLFRWFGGDIREVYAKVETKFWRIDVEDNAFAILTSDRGVTGQMHVSWTNWKNVFSFEVFGDAGSLIVNGLGGSYGPETLDWMKRKPEGGRPDIETFAYPEKDVSWEEEWKEFRDAVRSGRSPCGDGLDGLAANRAIAMMYESSRMNAPVAL